MIVRIVIPARNEAPAIARVVESVRKRVDRVIVVDNGSTDGTGDLARAAGAHVVEEPRAGYGRSCLAGIAAADDADVIVFMDGDGADDARDLPALLAPIEADAADFVVGSRLAGGAVEAGALTWPQRAGNALACGLMRRIWAGPFTDLGPFRAIRADALARLSMEAPTYGWTVEMQIRALKVGLACAEVPVRYRRRVGVSKVSGTVKGVALAGTYILGVTAREALTPAPRPATRRA